jgi:hypothetical protein
LLLKGMLLQSSRDPLGIRPYCYKIERHLE